MGHEIWLNRELVACDSKILSGFIERTFLPVFRAAGKAIMPVWAPTTILGNHDAPISAIQRHWASPG